MKVQNFIDVITRSQKHRKSRLGFLHNQTLLWVWGAMYLYNFTMKSPTYWKHWRDIITLTASLFTLIVNDFESPTWVSVQVVSLVCPSMYYYWSKALLTCLLARMMLYLTAWSYGAWLFVIAAHSERRRYQGAVTYFRLNGQMYFLLHVYSMSRLVSMVCAMMWWPWNVEYPGLPNKHSCYTRCQWHQETLAAVRFDG